MAERLSKYMEFLSGDRRNVGYMSNFDDLPEMAIEERLKGIAYQFIALYERWSEDRQVAAKQGADTAELVQLFTEQVKGFQTLEPKVRQQIVASIHNAAAGVAKTVAEATAKEATRATEAITQQLTRVTQQAENTLNHYQADVITNQWKLIGITAITTIITCLLLVWLLIPKPTLPLSNEQITYLNSGIMMELVWPKLTKKEQDRWLKLADELQYSKLNTVLLGHTDQPA